MPSSHRPNKTNNFLRRNHILKNDLGLIRALAEKNAQQNGESVGVLMHYIEQLRDENTRRGQHSDRAQILWKTIEELLKELNIRLEH